MLKTLNQLVNLFYILLFIPLAVGLALFVFDFEIVHIFNFEVEEIKLFIIVINSLGIISIKFLENYFKSSKKSDQKFEVKLGVFKSKMLISIAIIYILEIINAFAFLMTGDKIIIIIYFLLALLIFSYLPNKKKIENI